MRLRKDQKSFFGEISHGQAAHEEFEAALEAPETVLDNMLHMRPMIKDITDMANMPGWKKYIEPFLEKKQNPARLIELIEKGQKAEVEAAQMKAFGSILNLVRSMTRTKESMDRMAAAKAEKEAQRAV